MPASWKESNSGLVELLQRLWRRRGEDALMMPGLQEAIARGDRAGILTAEARFAVEHEMALTLGDVFRRLGIGQLQYPTNSEIQVVAAAAAIRLGWSETDVTSQIGALAADCRYLRLNTADDVSHMPDK